MGAQNEARDAVRDKALALRTTAIGLGQALPGQATAEAGAGLTAQNTALNTQLAAANSALANRANATATALDTGATGLGLEQGLVNLKTGATGLMGNGYGLVTGANADKASAAQGKVQDDQAQEAEGIKGLWNAIGTGATLLLGGTKPWILSSKKLKTDKRPIPEGAALEAVEGMDVESWRYKDGVADEDEHVGPYAEDFAAETGRGDGTAIPVQDAIGVTMQAVKDLSRKVDRLEAARGIQPKSRGKARGLMREAA